MHRLIITNNKIDKMIYFIGFVVTPLVYSLNFRDLFIFPKWICIYLCTALASARLIFFPSYFIISLPNVVKWCLGILALALLFNFFFHHHNFLSSSYIDRLCFVLLFCYFFTFFKQNSFNFLEISRFVEAGVLAFHLIAFSEMIVGTPLFYPTAQLFSGTFGNVNMSAQYVGISILFQFYLYSSKRRSRAQLALTQAGLMISCAYIYLSVCRSISIGVAFALLLLGLFSKLPSIRSLLSLGAGTLTIIVVVTTTLGPPPGVGWVHPTSPASIRTKDASTSQRSQLLFDAASLIRDNPWGIGSGNYEFAILPYDQRWPMPAFSETQTHISPHSTLFLWTSEEGLQFVIPGFLLIITLWFFFRRKLLIVCKSLAGAHCAAALGVLAVEFLFQYPEAMAFAFLTFTLLFAYFMAHCVPIKRMLKKNEIAWQMQRNLLRLGAVLFILGSFSISFSRYLEFNSNKNQNFATWACRLSPDHIYSCHKMIIQLIADNNLLAAREEVDRFLVRRPDNFLILRESAYIDYLRGNIAAECKTLAKYDAIFANKSMLHGYINNQCRDLPM